MFDFSNDRNKRKYQCFCCGQNYHDAEEFRSHVIGTHDEGREFLICPLPHCGFPVRDLVSHFKANHPGQPIPKSGQMKAIVWRDYTVSGKYKKTHKPKIREGWHVSTKMGKNLHYRSGWECTVYECLDALDMAEAYFPEPFEIPYCHEGEVHRYIPDILIHFRDGHKELWEVKPSNQMMLEQNQNKWYAAREACRVKGWDFVVIKEDDIEALKKLVRQQQLQQRPL